MSDSRPDETLGKLKMISGPKEDLRRVRGVSPAETNVYISGAGIKSLEGIERFSGLTELTLSKMPVDNLAPLLVFRDQLQWLCVERPTTSIDLESVFQLRELRELRLHWMDANDLDALAAQGLSALTKLRRLSMYANPDARRELSFGWLEHLPELTHLHLEYIGISEAETDLVIELGKNLLNFSFMHQSDAQSTAIAAGLNRPHGPGTRGMSVSPRYYFEPIFGQILEADGVFSVVLGFPACEDGMAQDDAARHLFAHDWSDLRPGLEFEQDGDGVYVTSRSRTTIEEVLNRAHKLGVVS